MTQKRRKGKLETDQSAKKRPGKGRKERKKKERERRESSIFTHY
jgi:hypothetical protein